MKSVGIITKHDIYNYGSIFQAYATQRIVADLGFKSHIIDYKYPNSFHNQKSSWKARILSLANRFLKSLLPGNKYRLYISRYEHCKNDWYNLTPVRYNSYEELRNNPPEFDIYLAGSDQIWRPEFTNADSNFFLEFAPDKAKRISYASSFGCLSIPDRYKESYKKMLSKFDYVGVREIEGVRIIRELTGKNASVVLDPTFLLKKEDWIKISAPINYKNPYILCYGLNLQNNYMEKLALLIQRLTGYDIIRINGKAYDYFNRKMTYVLDAGPAEWLSYFANASFILGQSFHATAFAINMNKPFFSILQGDENHDSRQKNILKLLKLEDRGITIGDDFPDYALIKQDINYDATNRLLDYERKKSIDYLTTALNSL